MRPQRWMIITPGSIKNMRCSDCGAEFTQWLGFIPLRHTTARRMNILWHSLLLLTLCMILGYAIPLLYSAITA